MGGSIFYCLLMISRVCLAIELCKLKEQRASLVAKQLRICLPIQGTWVQALAWEDPTCHRATKPVRHNY